jgi:hypothetical protein
VLYFIDVVTFVGDMPPSLPPDADEEIIEVAVGRGPQLHIALGMRRRPNLRYRMEVCDRLSAVLVGVGVCPIQMREIGAHFDLLHLWTEFPCNMTSLMHHIAGAARLLVRMRDGASSNTDDDEGGDDDH